MLSWSSEYLESFRVELVRPHLLLALELVGAEIDRSGPACLAGCDGWRELCSGSREAVMLIVVWLDETQSFAFAQRYVL